MSLRLSLVVVLTTFLALDLHAGEYELIVPTGWNSLSFPSVPAVRQESDLPPEVSAIVAYREGETLSWFRESTAPPGLPKLPESFAEQFSQQARLQLDSLQAHEGYMVYATQSTHWKVSFSSLPKPLEIKANTWTFCGHPVGAYGSALPDNQFSPPAFAPITSLFGAPLKIYYLRNVNAEGINSPLAWTLAEISEPVGASRGATPDSWNIKQAEAVWIHHGSPKSNVDKIEVSSSSRFTSPKSVVLDLNDSSGHDDLHVRLSGGRSCIFGLRELDWHFATEKPSEATLKEAISTSHETTFSIAGFSKLAAIHEQPKLAFSTAAAVVPYLETNHGPLNTKRALRISCDRKTKESLPDLPGAQNQVSRILQPGFYYGRLKLMSSTVAGDDNLPTVVVMLEVPELYGPYEGFVHAQVLSVRDAKRESPLSFFRNRTGVAAGAFPFEKLIDAALPNAQSIEIGRYPIRCVLKGIEGNPKQMDAVIEKRGSFIVNVDTKLSGEYHFLNNVQAFHGIEVALPPEKKTVFLASGLLDGKFNAPEAPILSRPIVAAEKNPAGKVGAYLAVSNSTIEGQRVVTDSHPTIVVERDNNSHAIIVVRRDIKMLLQEDSAGVLRGLMIERLGRSANESPEGTIAGASTVDSTTGKLRSSSVPVYVVGIVELRRVAPEKEMNK